MQVQNAPRRLLKLTYDLAALQFFEASNQFPVVVEQHDMSDVFFFSLDCKSSSSLCTRMTAAFHELALVYLHLIANLRNRGLAHHSPPPMGGGDVGWGWVIGIIPISKFSNRRGGGPPTSKYASIQQDRCFRSSRSPAARESPK